MTRAQEKTIDLKDRLQNGFFGMMKPLEDWAALDYPKLVKFEKEVRDYMGQGHAIIFNAGPLTLDPADIPRIQWIKPNEPVDNFPDMMNWINISTSHCIGVLSLDRDLNSRRGITYFFGVSASMLGGYLALSGVYKFTYGTALEWTISMTPDSQLEKICWARVQDQLDQKGMLNTPAYVERFVQEGKIVVRGDGTVIFPENHLEARQSVGTFTPVICAANDVSDSFLSDASLSIASGLTTAVIGGAAVFWNLKKIFKECAIIKKVSVLKDVFDHNIKVADDVIARSGSIGIGPVYINAESDHSPEP